VFIQENAVHDGEISVGFWCVLSSRSGKNRLNADFLADIENFAADHSL
jgi:hypothetical protein